MEIYPALDLLDGQCVRLREGNFQNKTVYSENPLQVIDHFKKAGARYLHLVDLSGAKDPTRRQKTLISSIISQSQFKVQCGGGIRSHQDVRDLLDVGADRVVIGSIAILDPSLTLSIIKEFGPHRITLAFDVKPDPQTGQMALATHGWIQTSSQNLDSWIQTYQDAGINRILCTDIRRDGTMTGPNFTLYKSLIGQFPTIDFQASGGISSLDDLLLLKKQGAHSAILGKVLYEGKITLQEAMLSC